MHEYSGSPRLRPSERASGRKPPPKARYYRPIRELVTLRRGDLHLPWQVGRTHMHKGPSINYIPSHSQDPPAHNFYIFFNFLDISMTNYILIFCKEISFTLITKR